MQKILDGDIKVGYCETTGNNKWKLTHSEPMWDRLKRKPKQISKRTTKTKGHTAWLYICKHCNWVFGSASEEGCYEVMKRHQEVCHPDRTGWIKLQVDEGIFKHYLAAIRGEDTSFLENFSIGKPDASLLT